MTMTRESETDAETAYELGADFGWIEIMRSIFHYIGPKLTVVVLVIGTSSFLEAAGLLMMLPVLDIIFSQGNSESAFSTTFLNIFTGLGADGAFEQLLLFSFLFLALMMLRAVRRQII